MHCPVCHCEFQPETTDAMPFCGDRCRTIDLGRWLDEGYRLPNVPNPEADETPEDDWAREQDEKSDAETP